MYNNDRSTVYFAQKSPTISWLSAVATLDFFLVWILFCVSFWSHRRGLGLHSKKVSLKAKTSLIDPGLFFLLEAVYIPYKTCQNPSFFCWPLQSAKFEVAFDIELNKGVRKGSCNLCHKTVPGLELSVFVELSLIHTSCYTYFRILAYSPFLLHRSQLFSASSFFSLFVLRFSNGICSFYFLNIYVDQIKFMPQIHRF